MMLTATQRLVLDALCAVAVYDFDKYKGFWHRPRQVAIAAGISYDRARRALDQLRLLGHIEKLTDEDEWITTELYYCPAWSHDRKDAPSGWRSEWDERMSKGCRYYLAEAEGRLDREDLRLREKRRYR